MLEISPKNLENEPKSLSKSDKAMSDPAYAQTLFLDAFPLKRYGKAAAAICEAYRILKPLVQPHIEREFTARRVRSLYEGAARRVDGAEIAALEFAKLEEARREQKELRERLARLDETIAVADEAVNREARPAMWKAMGRIRGVDRSRAER